jgi:signal peptidase I
MDYSPPLDNINTPFCEIHLYNFLLYYQDVKGGVILQYRKFPASELDDDSVEQLYQNAKTTNASSRRKAIWFVVIIVILVCLVFFGFFFSQAYKKIPLPKNPFAPPPTETDIAKNLSKLYGNIKVSIVRGNSMLPTYYEGQRIFVARGYYSNHLPMAGDVAEINLGEDNNDYLKRIIAVAGDQFIPDGNNLILENSAFGGIVFSQNDMVFNQITKNNYIIPKNTVLVLGDNRLDSYDSRKFGIISINQLTGKVVK